MVGVFMLFTVFVAISLMVPRVKVVFDERGRPGCSLPLLATGGHCFNLLGRDK